MQERKRFAEAFQFAEYESPELRKKRDLEAAIETTSRFLSIFPDARRCYHSISGVKDDTPDPMKLIIVMQDKTLIPTTQAKLQDGEDYLSFLQRVLEYIQGTSEDRTSIAKPIELPTPITEMKRLTGETPEIIDLLFAITCAGGAFSADPPEVGIFVYGRSYDSVGNFYDMSQNTRRATVRSGLNVL